MADNPRAYLDSCCFIDLVKSQTGKGLDPDRETDAWFLKRLMEANRDGQVDLFTSAFTLAESTHIGEAVLSDTVKGHFERLLLSGQYVKLVQVTPFISRDARDLRWKHNIALRGGDALHVASALSMKCDELLSSNGKLQRLTTHAKALASLGLAVRRAGDTHCLPAKYRQMELGDGKAN
jgi:predicted nucleic acid-binding protein